MSRKKCLFTEKLKTEYAFLKNENNSKVQCTICKAIFSIEFKGKADIERHLQSKKHKDAMKGMQVSSVSDFFKKQDATNDELQCIAKEITFAYHCVKHHLSFNASDCSSKLIKKLYDKKFAAGKTKLEALAVGVIGPYLFSEVLSELKMANFLTILIDTSNRKDVKLLPILVRYFNFKSGVQIKLLHLSDIPGETSDILTEHVSAALQKYNLSEKVVALSADNTNTNFGGVARQGQKNVYRKLETKPGRSIVGIGCSAHIIHNTVQVAADSLPVDLELICVKIYKFLYIYTVRNTTLKNICEEAEIEYKKILSHGNTRFLSLQPAIGRILQMYDALKIYFDEINNCPHVIKSYFSNPINEIYTIFLHGSLSLFQNAVLVVEADEISASEISYVYTDLLKKLQNRREEMYIPFAAKQAWLKYRREFPNSDEDTLKNIVLNFYDKAISYLTTWQTNFEEVTKFMWVKIDKNIKWEDVEISIDVVTKHSSVQDLNIDEIFDEITLVNDIINSEKETEKWKALTCVDRWIRISEIAELTHIQIINVMKIVEFALCIPGTSSAVERTFSFAKQQWSDERGRLRISILAELLNIQINNVEDCSAFYDKIKTNTQLLKRAASSEKYEWNTKSEEK